MKKWQFKFLALCPLAAALPAWGQQPVMSSIQRLFFEVSGSKAEVILPPKLNPGIPFSGSFLPSASNSQPLQLIINDKAISPNALGLFQFYPLSEDVELTMKVSNPKGKVSASQTIVASYEGIIESANCFTIDHSLYYVDEPVLLLVPNMAKLASLKLRSKERTLELPLLAATPHNYVYAGAKQGSEGHYALEAFDDAGSLLYCAPVNVVNLNGKVAKSNLRKGEQTTFEFMVKGLDGYCCFPVQLTVMNRSTYHVGFEGSPSITVQIDSAMVVGNPSGISLSRTAVALQTGDFEIEASLVRNDNPPVVFAKDDALPKPQPLKDEAILIGLDKALQKVWSDPAGAKGKEWDELCENCQKCLKARTGEWAEILVKELGEGIIKEFAGKALDLVLDAAKSLESIKDMVEGVAEAKEAYDNAAEKVEKLEELKGKIEDAIRKGELKIVELEPKICGDCLISGIIFYSPNTGCVTAVLKCQGTKLCCPSADNRLVLHYCTDEYGMPADKKGGVGAEVIKR